MLLCTVHSLEKVYETAGNITRVGVAEKGIADWKTLAHHKLTLERKL